MATNPTLPPIDPAEQPPTFAAATLVRSGAESLAEFDRENEAQKQSSQESIKTFDISSRIESRNRYGLFMIILLYLQNLAVFAIIFWALWADRLTELQPILSVVVTATLIETGYSIKIIVQFLFKDIDYGK